MWDKILSLMGGSIFGGVAEIIGKLKVDPTEAVKLEYALKQAEMQLQQAMRFGYLQPERSAIELLRLLDVVNRKTAECFALP